jgi:hypothetical protein
MSQDLFPTFPRVEMCVYVGLRRVNLEYWRAWERIREH